MAMMTQDYAYSELVNRLSAEVGKKYCEDVVCKVEGMVRWWGDQTNGDISELQHFCSDDCVSLYYDELTEFAHSYPWLVDDARAAGAFYIDDKASADFEQLLVAAGAAAQYMCYMNIVEENVVDFICASVLRSAKERLGSFMVDFDRLLDEIERLVKEFGEDNLTFYIEDALSDETLWGALEL